MLSSLRLRCGQVAELLTEADALMQLPVQLPGSAAPPAADSHSGTAGSSGGGSKPSWGSAISRVQAASRVVAALSDGGVLAAGAGVGAGNEGAHGRGFEAAGAQQQVAGAGAGAGASAEAPRVGSDTGYEYDGFGESGGALYCTGYKPSEQCGLDTGSNCGKAVHAGCTPVTLGHLRPLRLQVATFSHVYM